MPTTEQMLDLRIEALRAAVDTYAHTDLMDRQVGQASEETYAKGTAVVLTTAKRYYDFLAGTTETALYRGPVVDEQSDVRTPRTLINEGDTVQINTGQKFSVELDAKDAAGYDTDVDVTWTVDDTSVATVEVDADDDQKAWVVSGAPGSAVLTVAVNGTDPELSATLAVDVVPAGVATIELKTGDAVDEDDTTTPEEPTPGV